MFDIKFRDGSTAQFRNSLGIYIPKEFLPEEFPPENYEEYEASIFRDLLNQFELEPDSSYVSKRYVAILDVNTEDPIFIRIFIEDNFLDVKFSEGAPEIPYKNTRSTFIVE